MRREEDTRSEFALHLHRVTVVREAVGLGVRGEARKVQALRW